jgi:hypothetical protein
VYATGLDGLSKNRADACVGVLEVGCGVAIEGEHALKIEHVVFDAIARQIRVLERLGNSNCDLTGRRD